MDVCNLIVENKHAASFEKKEKVGMVREV